MNDDNGLILHCPECRQLVEVVPDDGTLVCQQCGWKFDEKIAAKFLAAALPTEVVMSMQPIVH